MIRYLSGCSNQAVIALAARYDLGLMLQPGNGYAAQLDRWPYFAADNGCFSQGERFDTGRFLAWLAGLPQRGRCLFAVAPDVFGDGPATLRRSLPVLPQIRALGYRAALVAQPWLTPTDLPWSEFDVLFLGGPNGWQYSDAALMLLRAAKARGLWIHRGRVNSERRLRDAAAMGCDSADGTYLGFGPDLNLPRLLRWLRALREQPQFDLWRHTA